jgi:hypothetical protein
MQRTSLLTAVGFFALAGAALAGPATKTHTAWASGRIARVDSAAHSVVVKQGTHELTFVLAANATLVQGGKTLSPGDLASDVGRAVKVRYSSTAGSKVADRVEVAQAATAMAAKAARK